MKILFISRAYPPVAGGIENQNYELSIWLSKAKGVEEVKTIANRYGRKFLPLFLPFATFRALWLMRKYDVLLLGDGVLSIVGWKVKLFYKKPVVSVVHGLDINYDSASLGVWYEKALIMLYQKLWVGIFLKKIDKLIAVGQETVRVAEEKGIPSEKIVFIPNGVDTNKFFEAHTRKELENILKLELKEKRILVTSGRLAKRKGIAWFVDQVMPRLENNIVYLISGEGPDRENIKKSIEKNNLNERVKLLGFVSNDDRRILLNTADIYIQANIKIPGDMEGFGLVVLEAASCQLPVVAARLEGLKDAVKDGESGILVEPYDADVFVREINNFLGDENYRISFGEKARRYVVENFAWEKIAGKYLEEIGKALLKSKG